MGTSLKCFTLNNIELHELMYNLSMNYHSISTKMDMNKNNPESPNNLWFRVQSQYSFSKQGQDSSFLDLRMLPGNNRAVSVF